MEFKYNPENKQHPCGFESWKEHSEFHKEKIILGWKIAIYHPNRQNNRKSIANFSVT